MPAYVCKSEKARLCNCYCIRNSFLKLCEEYLTVYLHQSLSINLRLGCPLGLTAYATSQFRSTESIRNTPTPDLQLISSVTVRVALSTLDQLRWKQLKYFVKHKKKTILSNLLIPKPPKNGSDKLSKLGWYHSYFCTYRESPLCPTLPLSSDQVCCMSYDEVEPLDWHIN